MKKSVVLITGGAGFIGSHVVRRFLQSGKYQVVNLDKLTYAGNLENLRDVENDKNYEFVKGDICDVDFVKQLFEKYDFSGVIHLAAESHVDRSITNPIEFIQTNVLGTVSLLTAAKNHWGNKSSKKFYHVSTD
jgi:dTDP-glucose 4,6-dehydratase